MAKRTRAPHHKAKPSKQTGRKPSRPQPLSPEEQRLARHVKWLESDGRHMNANSWMVAERPLTVEELRRVYEGCKTVQRQRQAMADVAEAEARAAREGVPFDVWHQTFNFPRDKRGNLISAELLFVSEASAFLGATNEEIAAVLSPLAKRDKALQNVRDKKRELRQLNIIVG